MQLCEGLRSLGVQAEIGTLVLGSPMRELAAEKGIVIHNLFTSDLETFDYDVIWAHHAPVLAYLLFKKQVADTKIIFSSLSSILPLEAPPIFYNDLRYFLSHNPVNTKALVNAGVPEQQIHYFPNFAPQKFFSAARKQFNEFPKKIAIVSNHPPKEIREFAAIAQDHHILVDIIGIEDKPVFVDEQFLSNYDLVITIGKTVQYCFALKIPIYCYDHFGGPGYIDNENFEFCRTHNFSGKATNIFRDKNELYLDILENYRASVKNLDFLYQEAIDQFCLESNLKKILQDIDTIPITNINGFRARNLLSERVYDGHLELLQSIFSLQEIAQSQNNNIQDIVRTYESGWSWKMAHPSTAFRRSSVFLVTKNLIERSQYFFYRILRSRKNQSHLLLLKSSKLFDQEWYVRQYPDVAEAKIDPAWHYLIYGWREGRDPGPDFSSRDYLEKNELVRKKGMNPLVWFILSRDGEYRENRSFNFKPS